MSDNDDPQQFAAEPSERVNQPEATVDQDVEDARNVEDARSVGEAPPDADAVTVAEVAEVAEVADVVDVEDVPRAEESAQVTEPAEVTEAVAVAESGAGNEDATTDSAAAPTTVVPVLHAPPPQPESQPQWEQPQSSAEAPTQFVPPLEPPQPQPQPQPQPAAFAAPGYPAPDGSGAYPAYQGQVPPSPYPQQYQNPYPGPYQNPQQAAPARPAGPPPVTVNDLLGSVFDAGRALLAGFVGVLVALLVIVYAGVQNAHVPAGDLFKGSVYLLGASLGTPLTGNASVSEDSGFGSSETLSIDLTIRVAIWALTFIVLFLLYRFARKREKLAPSRSLGQLFLRSAVTALVLSVIMLILALATRSNELFNAAALASSDLGGLSGSAGLGAGYVFLGPLLLALAAGLLGRFGVWLHAPTTADPRAERTKTLVDQWRPAVRVAWQQLTVMGTLIGIGLWIWLAVEAFQDPTTGPYRTALLLGALVLLPNLAVYGTFAGMGVTLFVGGAYGASVLGQSTSDSTDGSPTSSSSALGLFQGEHPWGLWLLLLAVIVGTLAPAVLARTTRRFAVNRDDYVMNGAWRSIVVAIVASLAVILLGALSLGMTGNAGDLGSVSASASLGPSLLGALGLASLWFLIAYLAVSLSQGHRFQPATPRQPAGIPPQGTPEYAQYLQYQQYQQYLQQQQQYEQYQQQAYAQQAYQQQPPVPAQPGPDQSAAGPTMTVPLAQPPVTQVTQALASEPPPFADPGPAAQQAPEPTLEQSQQSETRQPQFPQQPSSAEDSTQFVPAGQGASGTQELAPPAPVEPFQPNYGQIPQQQDPAQQYAEQYPQQYAQPYPQQQYPAQWAPPGQGGSAAWPQPGQQPEQPGARKGLLQTKIIVPLVLVALAGGGFLAYHLIAGGSSGGATGAVSAYFGDLASGDAKDAVALAEPPTGTTVITSAATLADAANRPTDFSVVSSRKATTTEQTELTKAKFTGTNTTVVVVKYTVRGKQITDTYFASQNAQGTWLLPAPYLYLNVTGGWSSKATVDGVSFTAQDGVLVFPGAHVISEPSNPDFSSESTTAVPTDYTSEGETWAVYGSDDQGQITLPSPTLSSTGQSAVQQAYSSALNDCASQAESGEGDCGIDNYYDYYLCNSVTWTISTVGTVTVDLSSQDSDGSFSWSSDGTVASESGDYTDYSGTDQTFSNQSADLQNDGSVVFNADGTATVTITD